MKRSFFQVRVSYTLERVFGENFRNLWNLKPYSDPNSPAVFFGLYQDEDLEVFLQHNSYSIVILGGGELKKNTKSLVKVLKKKKKSTFFVGYGWLKEFFEKNNLKCYEGVIKIKDFSMFLPSELGSKIYYYIGFAGNRKDQLGYDEIIKPLIEIYGENKFITSSNTKIENLYEEVYKNCFLYIKPIPSAGSTTMFEFAQMGIKTVSKKQGSLPNVIEYNNLEDIVEIIESESKKIGILQKNLSDEYQEIFLDDRWLSLEFYKKINE